MTRPEAVLVPALLLGCVAAAHHDAAPTAAPIAAPTAAAPSAGSRPAAQSALRRTVDSIAAAVMKARDIPGAAVAVVRSDSVVLMTGYGTASLERREPVTPDTRFQIASLTKPFTATAIMLLVADGRLGLDDRVRAHLPWLPAIHDSITVRDLLAHTSGVPRDVRRSNNDDISIDEFRRRVTESPRSFPRGTSFEYANTGYILLGLLIERASGRAFEGVLADRVLRPAGMGNTRYLERPGAPDAATGHEPVEGVQQRAPYFSGGFAAGGLSSSARDLAAFAVALHRGAVVPRSTLQAMWTPGRLRDGRAIVAFGDSTRSYGYGWEIRSARGRRSVAHGGGLSGFSSTFVRFEDGTTLIVLANSKIGTDRVGHSDAIANAIVRVVMP